MKKGLVCIHTAKSYADFIWYYCTYGHDYEWDIVLEPTISNEEQARLYRKSELFNKIIPYDTSIWDHKYLLLIRCIWSYITGRRRKFARKVIDDVVGDYNQYERVIIYNDYQFLEAAIIMLSAEKDVIWLEDGGADYKKRGKKFCKITGKLSSDLAFFVLGRMGYTSIANSYLLKNEKNCCKFSTFPEKIEGRKFKEHKKLNDMSDTNIEEYSRLIKDAFQFDLSKIKNNKKSIILFTAPLNVFSMKPMVYIDETIRYIEKNHRDCLILVKKHPRDQVEYIWKEPERVVEVDKNVPGELILDNIKFDKEYYMFPSTILMMYGQKRNTAIFKYQGLCKEKVAGGVASYKEDFKRWFDYYQAEAEVIEI
ncbi:hypothetical protein [Pseudobutyrivibrio ruminis]|uniref:Glycosyltransferase family 52 n=1 Tax=Pseudobutyrivibrio ruminis TaxID=46206 RepID=A0A2G3DTR5_9FIRM|nr:hypothetical protein [Pseudobutyrivibrio ruminis]PHU34437.1 hypothetical protein CSX01_09995 [Pseudobutyrivibrio ruminis]